jgi:hypothetical protein
MSSWAKRCKNEDRSACDQAESRLGGFTYEGELFEGERMLGVSRGTSIDLFIFVVAFALVRQRLAVLDCERKEDQSDLRRPSKIENEGRRREGVDKTKPTSLPFRPLGFSFPNEHVRVGFRVLFEHPEQNVVEMDDGVEIAAEGMSKTVRPVRPSSHGAARKR